MSQNYTDSSSDTTDKLWHTVINSDSDEELQMLCRAALEEERENLRRRTRVHRGSIQGHAVIHRGRISRHHRLYNDYFSENPIYTPSQFSKEVTNAQTSFSSNCKCSGGSCCASSLDLSALQKVTAAVRMLAYGVAADAVDDYVRIAEKGERRGFPRMLVSIDCMHWMWKNCLVAWKCMYARGDHREPSLILEAVVSYDLWIWQAFLGLPGSHSNINVLDRSLIFTNLTEGRTPSANYSINDHEYTTGYYLADGIYPSWATFVKTIPCLTGQRPQILAATQESARKDVERAFGMLQARFAIVRGPARFWIVKHFSIQ
ncbi:putative nuclease HARBI1 [Cinnamomum micranthum f. kanehirae]|uniref:Putative nuclease HARBI1 n=1 Tax=Cinnamomum micranthum f. kanehirae TaxID=337451 RepID=A0A443PTZ4_9MAGN|nr:putative nuclease HARBI1 [Cinnamomum micranthum f. kanehirae]